MQKQNNHKPHELAYADYKAGMSYRDIADTYGVSVSTVKSWQQRHWRKLDEQAHSDSMQFSMQSDTRTRSDGTQHSASTRDADKHADIKIDTKFPTNTLRALGHKQAIDTMPVNLYEYTRDSLPELTDKQARYVQEYMIDFNATQAAIRAGYGIKTAERSAARLMADDKIHAHITALRAELARRTGLNQDLIRREVARILRVNPADVIDLQTGEIKQDASPDDLAAVQAYEVKPIVVKGNIVAYERKVRFVPKDRLIEIAAKLEGMLIERKQVDVTQRVEEMTDDERRQRIRELQSKLAIDVDSEVIDE